MAQEARRGALRSDGRRLRRRAGEPEERGSDSGAHARLGGGRPGRVAHGAARAPHGATGAGGRRPRAPTPRASPHFFGSWPPPPPTKQGGSATPPAGGPPPPPLSNTGRPSSSAHT